MNDYACTFVFSKVIGLEDELARIREENDVGKDVSKEKTEKLAKRLHLMKQRYESLEKRRGLEVEGFKNDIKILRSRLKDVEKQLFKVKRPHIQRCYQNILNLEICHSI